MRRAIHRRVGILLLASAGACGGDTGPAELVAPALRVVETLTIGEARGGDEYLFAEVSDIAQHPDGTVFVLDGRAPVIRRYDVDGTYLHDVGGPGQGPGEYQQLNELEMLPNGNLAAWDIGNGRITVFAADGGFVQDFAVQSRLHTSRSFDVDRAGNLYVQATRGESTAPRRFPPKVFLVYSSVGEHVDTIELPDDEAESPRFVLWGPVGLLSNFSRQVVYSLTPAGHLIVGHNATYALEVREGGQAVRSIEREWEPVRLAEEERAQWQAWTDYIENGPTPSGFNRPPTPDYEAVPETKPALMGVYSGEDGSIWVRRYAAARERRLPPREPDDRRPLLTWQQLPTWDLFGEGGEFLGTLELPHDTAILEFHRDRLWCVRPDENDEDEIVLYRVETDPGENPLGGGS